MISPLKVYRLHQALGQGSYGTVFKAHNPRNGNQVAVKQSKVCADTGISYTTVREISLLKELSEHPNIVKFLDVYFEIDKVNLVFELLPMNLHDYIHQTCKDDAIVNDVIQKLLKQILDALNFCHKRRIIHRDLKPSNILLTDTLNVKLADFGIARAVGIPHHHHTSGVATLPYRAPELVLGETDYTTGVDMWSIGCIIYELCTRRVLFPVHSAIDLLDNVYKTFGSPGGLDLQYFSSLPNAHVTYPCYPKPIPSKIDEVGDGQLAIMITSVMKYTPTDRLSAEQCLSMLNRV